MPPTSRKTTACHQCENSKVLRYLQAVTPGRIRFGTSRPTPPVLIGQEIDPGLRVHFHAPARDVSELSLTESDRNDAENTTRVNRRGIPCHTRRGYGTRGVHSVCVLRGVPPQINGRCGDGAGSAARHGLNLRLLSHKRCDTRCGHVTLPRNPRLKLRTHPFTAWTEAECLTELYMRLYSLP